MKTASLFFAASMAAAAAAKTLSDVLPKCALPCVEDAFKGAECKLDDTACVCKDQETYQTLFQPAAVCMVKACGQPETLNNIVPTVINFCVAANPKLPSPGASASVSAYTAGPAVTKTTHAPSSGTPSGAASPASSPAASPAASQESSKATETNVPEKSWTSDQPSDVPEATASETLVIATSERPSSTTATAASEQPSSTTAIAAASSAAAAGAAGPMVAAAVFMAGAAAML